MGKFSKKYLGYREMVINLYPQSPLKVLVTLSTEDNENVKMDYSITGNLVEYKKLANWFKEECERLKESVPLYATYYPDIYEPIIDVLERERRSIQIGYSSEMEIVKDGRYDPKKMYRFDPNVLY